MPILETQALTRRFGTHLAVDALTLSIEPGEVFGLVGPNGAGKTTTLKMLTTLLPPTSGNARVAGFDIVRHASDVRRIIGYVPQLLSADGTLTGYENLLIFAKLYNLPRGARERRVREALEFMGLDNVADRLVREYSGGMIRRLEIAQSMLHEPRVSSIAFPRCFHSGAAGCSRAVLLPWASSIARLLPYRAGHDILGPSHNQSPTEFGTRFIRIAGE